MSQAKIDIELLNKICFQISHGEEVDSNFEILYNLTRESLQTFVFYMMRKHSSDVLQEAYQSFYMKLKSGFVPENPIVYLKSITRNIILTELRNRKKYPESDIEIDLPSEYEKLEDKELIKLIKWAVSTLDEKYREVFVLKEFQGFEHKDVAKICSISVDNSRARLTRAYKKINKLLSPYINEIKELS